MRGICRSDACGNDAAAHLDGGQNVGGVGALAALRANQAAGDGHGEQRVQQFMLRVPVHEPGPELAQDGAVEARVVERQGQQVLPIQSGSHRVGGVAIRQVLGELEQGDERQPPRCFGRAAGAWRTAEQNGCRRRRTQGCRAHPSAGSRGETLPGQPWPFPRARQWQGWGEGTWLASFQRGQTLFNPSGAAPSQTPEHFASSVGNADGPVFTRH